MKWKPLITFTLISLLTVELLYAQKGAKKSTSAQQKQEKTQKIADDKEMMDLANSKGCLACHKMDKKLIGPAWIDVSNKYGEKDIDYLVKKVIEGGVGVWGDVPMPPNRGIITDEEARKLVIWIVNMKNKNK